MPSAASLENRTSLPGKAPCLSDSVNLAAGALLVVVVFWSSVGLAVAGQNDAKPDSKASLPLKNVVLFSSGVGFFEHRAEVDGNAQIDLKFNVDDINDLLKSMVLQDLGGGRISTVTYTSKDPITKTLKTFSIDLTDNPTLAQILGQVRGEKVEVEAPNKMIGTIVGLEKQKRKIKKDDEEIVEIDVLNLLTDEGLKSLPLEQVAGIKLLDPKLNDDFRQALLVLASGHATDKKTVTLKFDGEGKRPVRVGYIQESPIWKTSYRLVLRDKESPLLQGWAIVENTTEEDWNDVRLTLVSGRPISFVMDLYEPLYVKRPVVEPELYASLRPQKYEQDLTTRDEQLALQRKAQTMGALAARGVSPATEAAPAPVRQPASESSAFFAADGAPAGVEVAAQAGEVGELFQYAIQEPVTLARQKSAMLPIVNGPVQAEKVAIYNAAVQPKHPLDGLRLTNTTELHLMQGPITVFDGGTYAGDAQIADLPPRSQRLVSYALDLDIEVAQQSKSYPEQVVSVKVAKGVMEAKRKYERSVEYTVKNAGNEAKKVLIEYPRDPNWKLVKPEKPEETTRDKYRFAVTVEPGKPATLEVVEEMVASQLVAVGQLDMGAIQFYLSAPKVSEQVKGALREVIKRRQRLEQVAAERQNNENQIKAISEEQTRIRENMAQLQRNTELYNRYVKKFGDQEDQVERMRRRIEDLTQEEQKLRQDLDNYLLGLNLE